MKQLLQRLRPRQIAHGALRPDPVEIERPADWRNNIEVIVPAYNHAGYLPAALTSLAEQDYSGPFTVRVIDDASTDSTRDVVDAFARTSNSWRTQMHLTAETNDSNLRQWASINAAVRSSIAACFVILNDDDLLAPYTLRVVLGALQQTPALGLIGGHSVWIQGEEKAAFPKLESQDRTLLRYGPDSVSSLRRFNDLNMTHSGMTFFRDAWQAVKGYRPPEDRIATGLNEDRDFQLRVCARGNIGIFPRLALAAWRSDTTHGKRY